MTALSIFRYDGADVRTVMIDGAPWFVASDVVRILGYSAPSAMTRTLDEDEKGVHTLHTPGGLQEHTVVSEPGLFSAILRSRVAGARAFKRWITHDVLPAIRQTGSYSIAPAAPALPQSYAEALRELAASVEQREVLAAANAELTPRAEAWDDLASADGDYSVADAANMLKRAGIDTGPQRLFEKLGEIRWTYRGEGGRWRPYARALDAGYLCERAMPPRTDHDGLLVPVPPQVRVTPRGLERLRVRLGEGALSAVEVSA